MTRAASFKRTSRLSTFFLIAGRKRGTSSGARVMSAERELCELMGYSVAVLFPRARDALAAWCEITQEQIKIPSNCCAALLPFASELVPVDRHTGLAPVPVQLYGYRQTFPGAKLEIDPLMTGLMGEPFADSTIVSFGYSKTIDIGGCGAILTH